MRTIEKIITKVDTSRGAPMGRCNVGVRPKNGIKIYDCKVPLSNDGAYDTGGVYWGFGNELRVAYTKDLSYIEFYRQESNIRFTTDSLKENQYLIIKNVQVSEWEVYCIGFTNYKVDKKLNGNYAKKDLKLKPLK